MTMSSSSSSSSWTVPAVPLSVMIIVAGVALNIASASAAATVTNDPRTSNTNNNNNNNNNNIECLMTLSDGLQYTEFSCLVPSLRKFYFEYETTYDPVPVLSYMQSHPLVPIGSCFLYMFFIVYGKFIYFNNPTKQPWKLRTALTYWNLFLSLFSCIGMIRTAPYLLYTLYTKSIRDNLCSDPLSSYGCGSTGLWVQLFILSKFPELFDTFFIVVHKKPLIFLHWYHHITVLLYCWHSYVTYSPPGIFFVAMNYAVHACMYFYYFCMAAGFKKHIMAFGFNPIVITALQISQMIVGVTVTLLGFYYYTTDPTCRIEAENNTAAFVMYGSYLFLFLQFFIGRYITSSKKKNIIIDTTTATGSRTSTLLQQQQQMQIQQQQHNSTKAKTKAL